MNSMFVLTFLFAIVCVNGAVERGEPVKLNEAIIAKYGETPCLNRVIGQRLTHPSDPHKFLRCMSLESLWIETCPDGLFYNPTSEICDWSSKPRPTTRSNEVVRNRPVLFKTRVNSDGQIVSEFETQPMNKQVNEPSVSSQAAARDIDVARPVVETVTPSLLDELRRKLNLVDSEKPQKAIVNEDVVPSSRRAIKMSEMSQDGSDDRLATTRRVSKLKLVEVDQDRSGDSGDFVIESSTTRRQFLKSLDRQSDN